MKIIFICGCLEPGRDGVGDYTRRLSGELIRYGHEIAAVSLFENGLIEELDGTQDADGVDLPVLRIPSKWQAGRRFKKAQERIYSFNPEWVSLQYVPYSFHPKGLPFNFHNGITPLVKNIRLHVMFHELWLDQPRGINQYIVAWFQQYIIYKLIISLKPKVIHVSISFNQKRLAEIGIESKILSLFGNIQKGKNSDLPYNFNVLNNSNIKILYFGTAPKGLLLVKVVDGFFNFCRKNSNKVVIGIIGSHTEEKKYFIQLLKEKLSKFDVQIMDWGFVDTSTLSALMTNFTVGVARSKPNLLGKSGSAIAMLEHGLPLWMPEWVNGESLAFEFRSNLIHSDLCKAIESSAHQGYKSLLCQVTKEFIDILNKS